MRDHTSRALSVVGALVGVIGLAFGIWQYSDARAERALENAERRGREAQVLKQLEQVVIDLRGRVGDLERMTRYLHGTDVAPARRE